MRTAFEDVTAGEDMLMKGMSAPTPEGFKVKGVDDSTCSVVIVRIGSDADKFDMTVPQYMKAKGRCPS